MSFKIEKGVPSPNPKSSSRGSKYPWEDMSVGDSFFVECDAHEKAMRQNSIGTAGTQWCRRRRPECRVITRQEDGGVRAWMILADGDEA